MCNFTQGCVFNSQGQENIFKKKVLTKLMFDIVGAEHAWNQYICLLQTILVSNVKHAK